MAYPIIQYPALPAAYTSQPTAGIAGIAGGSAPRRRIDMVVLHATAGSKAGDLYTLSGRNRRHLVSTHYYITKLGEIYQLVQDKDIAWHAGVSYWQGEKNCNRFSLGIELENRNDGVDKYSQPQYDALVWLCQTKVRQYNIPQSRFVRHSDVAPGRKSDPRNFPWDTFKAAVYQDLPTEPPPPPIPEPAPDVKLRDALLDFSYDRIRHVYHPDWAMHQFAIKQRLGPPVVPPFRFRAEGQEWVGELYGVDAVCSPAKDWQTVVRLSQMREGELKNVFRATAYAQLGVQHHPDWAQHQYADRIGVGIPLSENFLLRLRDGRAFGVQIYSLDTLYSPESNWGEVLTLNGLLSAPQLTPEQQMLRDELLNISYIRIGNRYHPDWATHQYAIAHRLGSALADQAPLKVDGKEYMVTPYARTVVFSPVGDWTIVRTLNELLGDHPPDDSQGGSM